jgi:hypothetical protein
VKIGASISLEHCVVCGNLKSRGQTYPCDRCHRTVCEACVTLLGPVGDMQWLCSITCNGLPPKATN